MDKIGIQSVIQFFFLEEKPAKEKTIFLQWVTYYLLRNCLILSKRIQMW